MRRISLSKTYGFHCASSQFTNADEHFVRRWGGLREVGLTRQSAPALYPVSVRSLAALTKMWLTTTVDCQFNGTFAGFLPTVRYLPAVALVSYLIDRSRRLRNQEPVIERSDTTGKRSQHAESIPAGCGTAMRHRSCGVAAINDRLMAGILSGSAAPSPRTNTRKERAHRVSRGSHISRLHSAQRMLHDVTAGDAPKQVTRVHSRLQSDHPKSREDLIDDYSGDDEDKVLRVDRKIGTGRFTGPMNFRTVLNHE